MQYRFYLDGNLLQDEPKGWKELVTSITEYDEIRAILLTQDVTLSFIGDGYTYLKNIFESDQVCALTELRIEYRCSSGFEEIFEGTIFLTSVSFLNNECKTKIEDNSFFAKINNNKSIRAYLSINRSKNGITISPAVIDNVNFFNPCSCAYDETRKAHRISDCFRYIIHFMTDGEIGFVSDAFGTGGIWAGHLISTGWKLRDPVETDVKINPFYSFKEIFQEVNKKYNIGMSIEVISGIPSVRIEPFEYFRTNVASITLSNPVNVEISSDISQLYAKVVIGSDKTQPIDSCSAGGHANFPENVDFGGFKIEEFPLLTECNIDTELNLVSSWIISHNVIEKIVYVATDQYDTDIVFLEADFATGNMISTDVFNDGNCYYNNFYSNTNVLNRWNSALPNIVTAITGNLSQQFQANRITNGPDIFHNAPSGLYQTSTIELFDDDFNTGFDTGLNYGGATLQGTPIPDDGVSSRFTVPINGSYSLFAQAGLLITRVFGSPVVSVGITVKIEQYDSADVLLNFWQGGALIPIVILSQSSFSIPFQTPVVAATATDYFIVKFGFSTTFAPGGGTAKLNILGNTQSVGITRFACIFNQGFGGELTRVNNNNFANIIFKFEYPITYEQYKTIRLDTKKPIEFNYCNKIYKAWIKDIKYNHHKNSKLTLRISKNGYRGN